VAKGESKAIRINFEGVDKEIRRGGGGRVHIAEGDYPVKIVDSETLTSERTGSRYIRWKAQITRGPEKGKTLYGTTSLKPDALWSLRNLIHAAIGKNVAGRSVNFDPSNIYGKEVAAAVEDNEYERDGRSRITSQISTFFPLDELEEGNDDEEDEGEEEEEEEEDEDLEDVAVDEI